MCIRDSADISRQLHHDIAKGYMGGFLIRKLSNTPQGSAVFSDGPEMAPLTSQVPIHPMYRDPVRLVLDDFESNPSLTTTSAGLPAAATHVAQAEASFDSTPMTLYHKTDGYVAAFGPGTAGLWAVLLDPLLTGLDATPFTHFSVKFAQRRNSPVNVPGQAQDVTLGLMDADLDLALVELSDFGTIPWPISHPGGGPFGPSFPIKSVLRTTRVPFTAFTAANPLLDLDRLLYAGWLSDQTPQGELEFDDFELTR